MSPWSYLSDLVSPVIGSFNSYLPVIGLPDSVQRKLVAFVLRKTLGRFVKHDGLLAGQVDEGISSGSISFERLELDPKAIEDLIPPNLPLEFVSGLINTALIQLPFPNLLSAPLSVDFESIDLHLRVKRISHETADLRSGTIAQSVLDISNDFLTSTLSPGEARGLSSSIHDDAADIKNTQQSVMAASLFDEREYQTPGGFPDTRPGSDQPAGEASGLPPTTVLASIIENVLARLQVNVNSINLRLTLPFSVAEPTGDDSDETIAEEDITLEVRLEGLKFLSEAGDSHCLDRVLRVNSAGLWMVRSAPNPETSETSSSGPGHGSGQSTPVPREHKFGSSGEIDPDGSLDLDIANSVYESAIGFDEATAEIDPFETSSSISSEGQEGQDEGKDPEGSTSIEERPAGRSVQMCAVEQPGLVFRLSRRLGLSGEGEDNLRQPGRSASLDLGHVAWTLRLNDLKRLRKFAAALQVAVAPEDPEIDRTPVPGPALTTVLKVASFACLLSQTEEVDPEISEDRADGDTCASSPRGLVLNLNGLEASTTSDDSRLTILEAGLSWRGPHGPGSEVEDSDLMRSVQSVPARYRQVRGNASEDAKLPMEDRQSFRLPILPNDPTLTSECGPFLSIVMRRNDVETRIAPIHMIAHMGTVEAMLPFIKRLSSITVSAEKERSPTLDKPVATREMKWFCAMIRLEVRFPLQDRYYETPSHIEGSERLVVLDITDIRITVAAGTSVESTFAGMHMFFGLLPDSESPGLPAIISVGDLGSEEIFGPHQGCCIKLAHPALTDDSASVRLPHARIWLDRESIAGLQYMADDFTQWLDTVLSGDDMSARDNIKLVSSRFFGPPVSSSPMDMSVAEMAEMRRPLARLALACVSLTLSAKQSSLSFQAAGAAIDLDVIEGKQVGTVITLSLESATIKTAGAGHPELILLHPRGTENSTKACISLTLATIQNSANSNKQTNIDLLLHHVALHTRGKALWMDQIGEILKPPVGVFTDVTPSDITKLTINIEQTAAVFHQPDTGRSLCFDVQQFRIRTAKRHHAIDQDFVFKSDEVRLLACDTPTEPSPNGNDWQVGLYCRIAQIQNLRATVSSLAKFEQTKIDIARLDLVVSACADSLRTTLQLLQDFVVSCKSSDLKHPSEKQSPQPLSLRHSETNALAHDLREKTYTPDTVKPFEGDLLDDDLPIDRQFLTVSRRGTVDSRAGIPQAISEGITIHCDEWFELHSDGYLASDADLTTQANKDQKQSIAVTARGCNLKLDLHDGYDWERTRAQIESKRKEMREKLRSLKELLASGQQSLEGLAAFSDFAFNSIHLGLPEHASYSSPEELASAIDLELAPEESLDGVEDAWQTLEPKAQALSPSKQAPGGLARQARAGMEFRFIGLDFDYSVPLVPRAEDLDARLEIAVASIEVVDQLPTSTWKTFLKTRPAERLARRSRQSDPDLSRCQIKWYPSPQALGSEAIMKLDILPVRMHVDQDAIDFCKRFVSFSDTSDPSRDASSTDPSRPGQFIQRAEISPIEIRLDYKPKRINMNSLRQGHLGELINLFHFEDSRVVLRKATVRGVSGWVSVYSALMEVWSPDIRATQMSDLVGGAAPVRSLIKVGGGVADLILLPIEQYQKDGRLVKGLQRGGRSFAKTTTLEAIKLSSKLATGTQVILERAEAALRSGSALPMEVVDPDGSLAQQRQSRYAEQPSGAREGLSQAYSALSHDLGSAVQTILAIPMEVHEQGSGSNASGRTVIRAVPLAVVQTMKGVTNASRKTLQGIRNQLDSQVQQDLLEKYK